MPEILGVTNPVPGHDKTTTNRIPTNTEPDLRLQNVPNLDRVTRSDGRSERQGNEQMGEKIRYDSNFQTFLQRLKGTPGMAESLKNIFAGREGAVVLSGMKDGISGEMAKIMSMLQMDEKQLLDFLTSQAKLGTRFGGGLFALLRGAYGKAASESVQANILQFLKSYSDYSSTAHLEGNILRSLNRMAGAIPARWGDQLSQLIAQLQNSMEAGDRQGALKILQQQIFPYMSRYVEQTHDMGLPRQLLSMLALDVARYENGSVEKMLEMFHQLRGYGTLKGQLGGIDDQSLMLLLQSAQAKGESAAMQFSNSLLAAAARALRGEGSMEVQQGFQNLIAAMLINESVYMPINHFLLPLQWDGKFLFSEMWVDPDAEGNSRSTGSGEGNVMRVLLKVDVQDLGMFDIVLTSQKQNVDVQIACPAAVSPHARRIEQAVSEILTRNELTPVRVAVRKMDRPLALTDVFPKLFEGRNGVNVKA